MDAPERYDVLPETDHVTGGRGHPSVDAVPQGVCSDEPTSPRNPVRPFVPDAGAIETFVDGAGI